MTQALPESLTRDMTPWQRRIAEAVLDPGFRGFDPHLTAIAGRRAGKAAAARAYVEGMAVLGVHQHVAARDGLWCVTRQPLGPARARPVLLWAKLPRGTRRHDCVNGDRHARVPS
jgi:hypothetical protein